MHFIQGLRFSIKFRFGRSEEENLSLSSFWHKGFGRHESKCMALYGAWCYVVLGTLLSQCLALYFLVFGVPGTLFFYAQCSWHSTSLYLVFYLLGAWLYLEQQVVSIFQQVLIGFGCNMHDLKKQETQISKFLTLNALCISSWLCFCVLLFCFQVLNATYNRNHVLDFRFSTQQQEAIMFHREGKFLKCRPLIFLFLVLRA